MDLEKALDEKLENISEVLEKDDISNDKIEDELDLESARRKLNFDKEKLTLDKSDLKKMQPNLVLTHRSEVEIQSLLTSPKNSLNEKTIYSFGKKLPRIESRAERNSQHQRKLSDQTLQNSLKAKQEDEHRHSSYQEMYSVNELDARNLTMHKYLADSVDDLNVTIDKIRINNQVLLSDSSNVEPPLDEPQK